MFFRDNHPFNHDSKRDEMSNHSDSIPEEAERASGALRGTAGGMAAPDPAGDGEVPAAPDEAPVGTPSVVSEPVPDEGTAAELRPAELPPTAGVVEETAAGAGGEAEPAGAPAPISTMERSRALWKELEPTDPTDPVIHLDHDRCENGDFLAIGASRRGRSHAHDAKYREDAFRLGKVSQWLILAVADGAGSKPLSRVGARVACDSAVAYLKGKLENLAEGQDQKIILRAALSGAMAYALAEIVAEAAQREKEAEDFACTLLLAAYSTRPENPVVGIAQVGDGGIAAQTQNGSCGQLSLADRGAFAGEALFITSRDAQMSWANRARVYQLSIPLNALLLATDGVMDDFIEPLGKLEDLFTAMQPIMENEQPEKALLEWLNYERRGSFDDRTVVVLYPHQAASQETE